MNEEKAKVEEKLRKRYALLRKLYDETNGNEMDPIPFFVMAEEEGLSRKEAEDAFYYLSGEHLIKQFSAGGFVVITHIGVVEVEQSIMNPDKSTEHFSPSIIQHFNAPVGAVQNASYSTANVNQNMGVTMTEVLGLVREMREALQSLPLESQETTTPIVDIIEAEVQSDEPDVSKIKALTNGVKLLALAASTSVTVVSAAEKVAELADKIISFWS